MQTTFRLQNEDFACCPGRQKEEEEEDEPSHLNTQLLELVTWRPLLGIYLSRVHSLFFACGLNVILLSQVVSSDLICVGPNQTYHFHPIES